MTKRILRRRMAAFGSAVASFLLIAAAVPSPASADTMRTLNVAFNCETGLPYGMSVDNGSGFYYPNGSSYAVGVTKHFTVYIPASASVLAIDTGYCDGEQSQWWNAPWRGSYASITPGTSTVNANGYCDFDDYYGQYSVDCSVSNITYS
jgi:hypothetical protein